MHGTAERFVETVAEEYGFEPEVQEFPEGTKTAEDAANAIGCDLGAIVKSLVFMADEPVLVLTSGVNRVDEQKLADYLAADVRTANPSEVKEATGWSIGGVPPFPTELNVILDPELSRYETVWAAAGTPEAVFPTKASQIKQLTGPEEVDVFE